MQSPSEPGRPTAASAGAEASGAEPPPRRRIVVEFYSPDPPRAAMDPKRRALARERGRWQVPSKSWVRPSAALVVVAVHVVAIVAILSQRRTAPTAPAPAVPLEVFVITRPLVTLAEQAADLPQPEPLRPPPVVLRMPSLALPADGNEIAITISQSTAVTIGEANPAEVAKVVHSCRAARLARPRSGVRVPDLTLLVRVEQDGRVTDSRVEVGSGDARLDNSALGCLREHGLLTPQQLHGESVASWQRVHWSASGA